MKQPGSHNRVQMDVFRAALSLMIIWPAKTCCSSNVLEPPLGRNLNLPKLALYVSALQNQNWESFTGWLKAEHSLNMHGKGKVETWGWSICHPWRGEVLLSSVEVSLQDYPQSIWVLPAVNKAMWVDTVTQPRQTVQIQNIFSIGLHLAP